MQDKIQEIMGLVNQYGHHVVALDNAKDNGSTIKALAVADSAYSAIQSKLRELVREPLSYEEVEDLHDKVSLESDYGTYEVGFFVDFTREVERAHNITNTSGVEG